MTQCAGFANGDLRLDALVELIVANDFTAPQQFKSAGHPSTWVGIECTHADDISFLVKLMNKQAPLF